MPRHPSLAHRTTVIGASVFEALAPLLHARAEPFVKLHIGDADVLPPYALPFAPDFLERSPHALQYANTWGVRRLREALRAKAREDNGIVVDLEGLMVSAGASNALSAAVHAIVDPGDEVVVLTPAWPFFPGMVRFAGGEVREVPTYTEPMDRAGRELGRKLERAVGPHTVAVYLNSPNNPSGVVLSPEQVQAVVDVAARHDLWILADEAYDGLLLEEVETVNAAALHGGKERTFSVFTFSKSFLLAGQRLGWITGPVPAMQAVNRAMVHQVYGPNVPGQYMMIEPVQTRHQWLPRVREAVRERRDAFLEALGLDLPAPAATYFLFFDATPWVGVDGVSALVEECIRQGVAISPGGDFGVDFRDWVRLCFTADRADRTLDGARRLRDILGA